MFELLFVHGWCLADKASFVYYIRFYSPIKLYRNHNLQFAIYNLQSAIWSVAMRICVVGAGAIGGYLGARLVLAGEQVTLIARGAHLQAIQAHGLTLQLSDGTVEVALPALAPAMRALYDAETVVVPMQNGIPWWYFHKHGGPYEGRRVESVDPDGAIAANIEVDRVIGCVVYPAAELVAPGVVRHVEGNRFSLGELDSARTERIQRLAQLLNHAGLKAPIRPRI